MSRLNQRFLHTFAAAAALLTIGATTVGCGGGGKKNTQTLPAAPARAPASAATLSDLRALRKTVGHDIFWAGRQRGYTYELTRTSSGDIYIRYLPPGVPVGAAGADFLSIGTYAQSDAFGTVKAAQKQSGEVVTKLGNGGVAVASPSRPQSVYFAYPGSKLLVEVYDPSPTRAHNLVARHSVVPIR